MIGYSRLDAWPDDEWPEEDTNQEEKDYYDPTDSE
jgi:hypothetical protein